MRIEPTHPLHAIVASLLLKVANHPATEEIIEFYENEVVDMVGDIEEIVRWGPFYAVAADARNNAVLRWYTPVERALDELIDQTACFSVQAFSSRMEQDQYAADVDFLLWVTGRMDKAPELTPIELVRMGMLHELAHIRERALQLAVEYAQTTGKAVIVATQKPTRRLDKSLSVGV